MTKEEILERITDRIGISDYYEDVLSLEKLVDLLYELNQK